MVHIEYKKINFFLDITIIMYYYNKGVLPQGNHTVAV